ncbi:hypothetical protein GK368_21580 [Salmonella enterica]|nr:hypothetical protein [Salmonella enterica]EIY5288200.1 hypothetical protein [Salmonella enterica]
MQTEHGKHYLPDGVTLPFAGFPASSDSDWQSLPSHRLISTGWAAGVYPSTGTVGVPAAWKPSRDG